MRIPVARKGFLFGESMVKITYFVHGTTTDNERELATGWLPGELFELGKKQSRELPDLVGDLGFDTVFCSDLGRAIDSARLGFAATHPIIIDKRLREANYGDFNGKPDSFKDSLNDFVDTPFPNGESYKDVKKRMADFLAMLRDEYAGRHVAIVAHHAPQLALDVLVGGKTWEEAIETDWRKSKAWQPGWIYEIKENL